MDLIEIDGELLEEDWSLVRDFPRYLVSNYGRVADLDRDLEVVSHIHRTGYVNVKINDGVKQRSLAVHRLVAGAFVPGWDVGLIVNHIDGVKTNNVETNLEWCTYSDNMRHAHRIGLNSGRGLPIQIVETGQTFPSISACAKFLNGSDGRIHDVLSKKRRSYRNMTFTYI